MNIANYYDENGVVMISFVGMENLPRWLSSSYAQYAWDYMSKFSRNEDGTIIVAE